jgi:hypothetical protein
MAIKFPNVGVRSGEIINPDDTIESVGQIINECNGNIDSDNLGEQPFTTSYSSQTFHETKSFSEPKPNGSLASFIVPHTTSAYVKRSSINKQLAGVEIDAETDGWAIIDFNACFKWRGTGITNAEMAQDLHMSYLLNESTDLTHLQAGIGLANLRLPAGGWMGVSGEYRDSMHNPNSHGGRFDTPLRGKDGTSSAGFIEMNFPLGQFSDVPVDFYCVQFRIVVNGNLVAESGPLFNGNWKNSVYLCGCIPLTAGKNKIDAEVRGYTAIELKTSRCGVGARDKEGLRGERFPFQTISSDVHPSPLPEFVSKGIKLEDIDANLNVKGEHTDLDAGIECTIEDRHLLVQYRKR